MVGASGFIGSAVVARLCAEGMSVSRFTRDVPFDSPSDWLDSDAPWPRTIFWLAGSTNPAVAEQRPDLIAADELALTEVLSTVAGAEIPPRVVLVSSGGTVYDPAEPPPYTEGSPLKPTTAYGRAKLALEQLVEGALPPQARTIVRVANAYGPGQQVGDGQGVIAHWLHAAAEGRPLVLIGDAGTARDFVYVDDVADALVRIHRSGDPPPVVNVGSGQPTSLGELRAVVARVVGRPAGDVVSTPARLFDQSRTWLDVSLAEATLGWRPATQLPAGVEATWHALTARSAAGAPPLRTG